jgi:Holliday junction resolvase
MAAEKNFENRLKKFLEDEGCWFVKFFANAYTKSGVPDILCCCHGYFLAIEVKAPKGKPSELQKWNIQKIIEQGGYGVILYPDQFDDFKEMVIHLKGMRESKASKVAHEINERWLK